jgi:hypothetical protein
MKIQALTIVAAASPICRPLIVPDKSVAMASSATIAARLVSTRIKNLPSSLILARRRIDLRSRPGDHDAGGNEIKPGFRVPGDQKPCRQASVARRRFLVCEISGVNRPAVRLRVRIEPQNRPFLRILSIHQARLRRWRPVAASPALKASVFTDPENDREFFQLSQSQPKPCVP